MTNTEIGFSASSALLKLNLSPVGTPKKKTRTPVYYDAIMIIQSDS